MITLTEDDVRQRLDPTQVITAIESAFRDHYASTVIANRAHLPTTQGVFLIMPCYDRAANVTGMKLVVVHDKPARPEDRIQATYLLFDSETARPRLMASANYLTDLRTAATSAVATKFLAREDARVLGIFGTGRQARAHIQVLPLVRRFERVLLCGNHPARAREFATQMSQEINRPVESVDAQTCVTQSDVLCTCTTSQLPLFDGNQLRPGTHLNLVGAFQPHAREVDSRTVQRARIVVDTYDGALAEAGDLLIPIKEGVISRDHIAADLHELLAGKKRGRTSPSEITLFKSVGCALEDLVTAELLGG
jgi:alanine dehydrogenase